MESPEVKTTVSMKNFGKQNTPSFIEKVGNACLLVGLVGGVVAATAPATIPIVVTIGIWSAVAGAVGKVLTKFAGQQPIQAEE